MEKFITEIGSIINGKIEQVFIDCLKKKGYVFDSRYQLLDFVKLNVTCTHNANKKTSFYLRKEHLFSYEIFTDFDYTNFKVNSEIKFTYT